MAFDDQPDARRIGGTVCQRCGRAGDGELCPDCAQDRRSAEDRWARDVRGQDGTW